MFLPSPKLGEAAGLETLSEDLRNDRDIVLAAVRKGVRWMFELRNGIGSCLKHSCRIFFSQLLLNDKEDFCMLDDT